MKSTNQATISATGVRASNPSLTSCSHSIFRAYKFRIYPNAEQRTLLAKHFGCCRFAYNHFLRLKNDSYRQDKKGISLFETHRLVAKMRKSEETEWLAEVYGHASRQSFTTILTYDKSTNGGIVKKGVWNMPDGPYTIDPPHSPIGDTPFEDPAEAPTPKPTETVTKISDLVKTRGCHRVHVSVINADALLRGDKTIIICSASHNVQKGDWLVPNTDNKPSHALNDTVWEVTFVTYIRQSEGDNGYGQVALSIRRIPNARFKEGDIAGTYFVDCIVTTNP